MNASAPRLLDAFAARLRPGADLREELDCLTREHKLIAACVLTAVGSLSRASIRYAGEPAPVMFERPFEIVSLSGTLSADGPHLHICVADENGLVIGGHLAKGSLVRTTVELVIGVLANVEFSRTHDPATGYRELRVRIKRTTRIEARRIRPKLSL